MKKRFTAVLAGAGMLTSAWAQTTIIDTDFSSYSDGNLAGQSPWLAVINTDVTTGSNPFNVTNSTIETKSITRVWQASHYAYIDPASGGVSAADDQWNGSMDYQFSFTTNIEWKLSEFFYWGTSATATNVLRTSNGDDLVFSLGKTFSTNLLVHTYNETGEKVVVLDIPSLADVGIDQSSDIISDWLNISWTVRKTRSSGLFTVNCAVSNKQTGVVFAGNPVVVNKPGAYAATQAYHMLGHNDGARFYVAAAAQSHYINSTLDSLKITATSGNDPVALYPTEVTAVGGSGVVDLSWPVVADAETYDVLRSLTTNEVDFTAIASGISANAYSDTGVTDGTVYYYKVVSKATGVASATSETVQATPQSPVTGTFINTHFTGAEGFISGDLDGQQNWASAAITQPNAFNVDPSGSGIIEFETAATANRSTNQVYYSLVTSNEVGTIWNGTIGFTMKAQLSGSFKTNIAASVTNVYEVAQLNALNGLVFGLVLDPENNVITPRDDADASGHCAVISANYSNDGKLILGFNAPHAAANVMLELQRSELGWDPEWADTSNTAGPILETLPIHLDWSIRKATVGNTYNGTVTATVDGVVYVGKIQFNGEEDGGWWRPKAIYPAELVHFGIAREVREDGSQVYFDIDYVSVTHSPTSAIPHEIPISLSSSKGDLELTVNWNCAGEGDSYNVYRSDTNGTVYTLIGNTTAKTYTDTGLENKRSYFYKVSQVYSDGESGLSTEIINRAMGRTTHWYWGGDVNSSGNYWVTGVSSATQIGALNFFEGNGVNGSVIASADDTRYIESIGGYINGIWQIPTNVTVNPAQLFELRWNDLGTRIKTGAGAAALFWVDCTSIDNTTLPLTGEWKSQSFCRPAIRNGSTWYVGKTAIGSDTSLLVDDEEWTVLDVADATSTQIMSVAGATFTAGSLLNLNDINAVGFFVESSSNGGADIWSSYMRLLYGTTLTPYEYWADSEGIYNEDAAEANDLDSDGLNNRSEWGLGGDPQDAMDVGITERYSMINVGGNFLYIHPVRSGERPTYVVEETSDLVNVAFAAPTVPYVASEGGEWPGEPDFNTMTNIVPTAAAQKFIRLNVQ